MVRLVLLLIIATASAFAQELTGRYVLEGVHEAASELVLKPDGSFEYALIYGAADYWAKGKWRSESGFLILNSVSDGKPAFRLLRSSSIQEPGIRIWVRAANDEPVENIDVALRTASGASMRRTGEGGAARFPDARTARTALFRVSVYQYESKWFDLNPEHNDFHFEINGDAIRQVPFKEERLTAGKGILELRYWNKDQPIRYRKQ